MTTDQEFLEQAVALATANIECGGRPVGAVLVKDGAAIATGVNAIAATGDPTAHAELQAIRAASAALGSTRLDGCVIYASGQPCPMCLSAMYLTGIARVYFAYSNDDGEPYDLSTAGIYQQLAKPRAEQALPLTQLRLPAGGEHLYENWRRRQRADG
jgi:tRNA(Arg) A34 adenosine deaminase TadA